MSTVEQLQRAIPRCGNGAPARAHSQRERILALLRERGATGVLASELYDAPSLYGRSPRNRISELRQDGHLIEGRPHGASDWHYTLLRENAEPSPRRSKPRRAEQIPLAESVPCEPAAPGPCQPAAPEMKETMERVARDDFYEPADWYERATGKARPAVAPEVLFLWERRP
jgi:hypothetical protein